MLLQTRQRTGGRRNLPYGDCYPRGVRIGLVILHADAARGGAERYTLQLAEALANAGHDVALLAASSAADVPAKFVPLAYGGLTRSARYRSFCRALRDHLREAQYDIVHAMLPVPPGLCDLYHPHAGVAASRTGAGMTWWTNPRRRLFARIERQLLTGQRPPLVLTLSKYVEDELRRHYPALPPDRTARLFNAVDLARFTPDGPAADRRELGAKNGDTLALFVGNDFARKGLDAVLIRMYEGADGNFERLKLAVAGHDPRGRGLQRQTVEPLRLSDRIRFLGQRRDLPELYRAADVLVLPTRHDPCSLVVLEALACGLPVISTRQNGASEIMTDGEHGYILDSPRDPRLAQALEEMLDPQRRRRMRQACLALRPALSWEHHLATLMGVYERVVRNRAAAR